MTVVSHEQSSMVSLLGSYLPLPLVYWYRLNGAGSESNPPTSTGPGGRAIGGSFIGGRVIIAIGAAAGGAVAGGAVAGATAVANCSGSIPFNAVLAAMYVAPFRISGIQ